MDFGMVFGGEITQLCTNLECNDALFMEWKDGLACPICGQTYDEEGEDEQSSQPQRQTVRYGVVLNKAEDTAQIARIDTAANKAAKQLMRTAFDDMFLSRPGVTILSDEEHLPLSVGEEKKRSSSQRIRTNENRQGDFGRTKSSASYYLSK